MVHDFYKRFVNQHAGERELVRVGRVSTTVMMLLASLLAYQMQTAGQGFSILLQVGAGTGLIYILRWYWWRINAYAEICAMIVSFVIAVGFEFVFPDLVVGWMKLPLAAAVTSCSWVLVMLLTPAESSETLEAFCRLIRPSGPGWAKVYREAAAAGRPIEGPPPSESLPLGILRMLLGTVAIYAALFAVGYGLFGQNTLCLSFSAVCVVSAGALGATYRATNATGETA